MTRYRIARDLIILVAIVCLLGMLNTRNDGTLTVRHVSKCAVYAAPGWKA